MFGPIEKLATGVLDLYISAILLFVNFSCWTRNEGRQASLLLFITPLQLTSNQGIHQIRLIESKVFCTFSNYFGESIGCSVGQGI